MFPCPFSNIHARQVKMDGRFPRNTRGYVIEPDLLASSYLEDCSCGVCSLQ